MGRSKVAFPGKFTGTYFTSHDSPWTYEESVQRLHSRAGLKVNSSSENWRRAAGNPLTPGWQTQTLPLEVSQRKVGGEGRGGEGRGGEGRGERGRSNEERVSIINTLTLVLSVCVCVCHGCDVV